jgi:acetyl esterase/lipase
MCPSTRATFQKWASSKKIYGPFGTSELRNTGGALHWMGLDPNHVNTNSKLILFFHGGGYAVPLTTAHLDWCAQHIRIGRAKGVKLSAAILEYDLCPGVHYPHQLQQAAASLEHILNLGFSPRDIIIGGDSAGGNLTFALIGHLLHPHPAVTRIDLAAPLGGAFGISPWLTMDMSTISYRENGSIDMLSPSLVLQSGHDFLRGTTARDEILSGASWSLALDSSPTWWDGLGNCVSRVYLNAGEQEMFREHVLEFAQTLQRTVGDAVNITLDVGKTEAHDNILTDFMVGNKGGRAFWALTIWMLDILR